MVRFPHPFKVWKTITSGYPPVETEELICEGMGNAQTSLSGGTSNEQEAMEYDFVLYHKEVLIEDIKAEYRIEVDIFGQIFNGKIVRAMTGQITKRIWFNSVSD